MWPGTVCGSKCAAWPGMWTRAGSVRAGWRAPSNRCAECCACAPAASCTSSAPLPRSHRTWRSEAAAPSGSPRGASGGVRRRRASHASRPRTR
eukprot:843059-Prymnesium_polylepis.1